MTTAKKFEITDITHPDMPRLRRIRALRDIPSAGVEAGDLGGWVEKEFNLSQSGTAWVSGNAEVSGNARVFCNARVSDYAEVFGNARVFGDARVYGTAEVSDNARVSGSARVSDRAEVLHAIVMGSAPFRATLHKTRDGHALRVGCWSGTVPEFRTMIESGQWVEATPDQIELRRPELLAFASMCEARIATWDTRGRQ